MKHTILSLCVLLGTSALHAYEAPIKIVGEFKAPGQREYQKVFETENAKLEITGRECRMIVGLLSIPCTVSYTDADSLTTTRTRIQMNYLLFSLLQGVSRHNAKFEEKYLSEFKDNIRGFSHNHDSMVAKNPIDFYLFEEPEAEISFPSVDYRSSSRVRVTRH